MCDNAYLAAIYGNKVTDVRETRTDAIEKFFWVLDESSHHWYRFGGDGFYVHFRWCHVIFVSKSTRFTKPFLQAFLG